MDREQLADYYKLLSGKNGHDSDCATSLAPAETPGPCDCEFPWNPITEPLRPTNGDVCLVTLESTENNLTYGKGGKRYTYHAFFTNDEGVEKWRCAENLRDLENGFWLVTAWMLLPKPFGSDAAEQKGS